MAGTYGTKLAPAVGRGLGGLPSRDPMLGAAVGDILFSATPPDGRWLLANGAQLPISQYPALAAAYGEYISSYTANNTATLPTTPATAVNACALSPDGVHIVMGNGGASAAWKRNGDTFTSITIPDAGGLNRVEFSPDGTQVLFAALTSSTLVYSRVGDTFTLRANVYNTEFSGNNTFCASYDPKSMYFAYGTDRGAAVAIRSGNNFTSSAVNVLEFNEKAVFSVRFSPDGKYLATFGADTPRLKLYSVGDGGICTRLPGAFAEDVGAYSGYPSSGVLPDMCWSPDSKVLAVTHPELSSFALYSMQDGVGTKISTAGLQMPSSSAAIKFSPDGDSLLVGSSDGVFIYPTNGAGLEIPDTVSMSGLGQIHDISFPPGGYIVVASEHNLQMSTPGVTVYIRRTDGLTFRLPHLIANALKAQCAYIPTKDAYVKALP